MLAAKRQLRSLRLVKKNYKLFNCQLTPIDFYSGKNLDLDSDWKFIDISDTLQYYFEINVKFTNIATQSIIVCLRNKETNKEEARIRLVDKNIIKFSEDRSLLRNLDNLNQKYELYWELKENQRNGIIYFDHPIVLEVV